MFGINGAEFVVLLVLALVVVGPERLPSYAEQLGRWVRSLRGFLSTAKERVAEEMGEDAADVDWAALDPRRYDPRRIVREALLDDADDVLGAPGAARSTAADRSTAAGLDAGGAAGATASAATSRSTPRAPRGRALGARPGTGQGGAVGLADERPATGPAPFDDEAT